MSGDASPSEGSGRRDRIKIAFVIDRLFLPAGGTETQLVYLLEGLDRRRFAPALFCLQDSGWLQQAFGRTKSEVLDLHLSHNPLVAGKIRDFSERLRNGGFDIVQTQFRDSNIVGILAATLADVDVIVSTRRGVPYWSTTAGLVFLKFLNRRVTRFLANSEATRDRLIEAEGVEDSRVTVIHNGLDPRRYPRLSGLRTAQIRRELGIPVRVPIVGIVANQRAVKGNDLFIKAAAAVHQHAPSARFVLVGDGPERGRLEQLADELGLDSRTLFLGARNDVPELLQVFDVGVLASRFESFSNSILEYLASDLPVVVTDVGGAREAVREGEDGFIVPPNAPDLMAEAIIKILGHPEGPGSWRHNAGLNEQFHVRGMIEAHERFYESLVTEQAE